MKTIRFELLKLYLVFTFLLGFIILYAGIWSLNMGFGAGKLLYSNMSSFLWVACIIFFTGAILGSYLIPRSTKVASWILCLFLSAGIFVLLRHFSNSYDIIAFLLPILISVFLFDLKEVLIIITSIMGISTFSNINNLRGNLFQDNILIPGIIILTVSFIIVTTAYFIVSNLKWYEENFISAYTSRQIIRENEIELQHLVRVLNNQKEILKNSNELLAIARNEAEEAKKVKQIFVQNVSHELRTPLNLIIGFAETLVHTPQAYAEVNWTPELMEDVDCIYQNSQHLKSLIDDVLNLAALESNSFEIHQYDFDIYPLIHDAVKIIDESFTKKGLSIKINLEGNSLMVHADAIRIKQVILNILTNSLKYTSKGMITISAGQEGNIAHVKVEDTGKGIPKSALGKIFEPFYQVNKSGNYRDSGTGLGLSISKQLIELNGGQIKISSKVGKGTIINFTLPIAN